MIYGLNRYILKYFLVNIHFKLILTKLNPDTPGFEIIEDPDQLASLKPADQDHQCFSL